MCNRSNGGSSGLFGTPKIFSKIWGAEKRLSGIGNKNVANNNSNATFDRTGRQTPLPPTNNKIFSFENLR